ncbi:MAG: hypothetical protein GEU28_09710 [Dehalococcoidia bacterium]|nr:hypothetical protein [Dehalococcoidia bacterium]
MTHHQWDDGEVRWHVIALDDSRSSQQIMEALAHVLGSLGSSVDVGRALKAEGRAIVRTSARRDWCEQIARSLRAVGFAAGVYRCDYGYACRGVESHNVPADNGEAGA